MASAIPTRRQCKALCAAQRQACTSHRCRRDWIRSCRRQGAEVCLPTTTTSTSSTSTSSSTTQITIQPPPDGPDRWEVVDCSTEPRLDPQPGSERLFCFHLAAGTGYGAVHREVAAAAPQERGIPYVRATGGPAP